MTSSTGRPPRLRALPAHALEGTPAPGERLGDAELLDRLERALAELPEPERAAAVVAFGLAEGSEGVALEQRLDREDAEALTRSAVQLLRGRLQAGVVDPEILDDLERYPTLPRRNGRRTSSEPT